MSNNSYIITFFAKGELEAVVLDMTYFVKKAVIKELIKNKGDLSSIQYNKNSDLYNYIFNNARYPVFNTNADRAEGLQIAINDTWGNSVEVNNYELKNGKFKGNLHFTIYDHFGLDRPDVEKTYVNLQGFKSWFVLQHYDYYRGKYKPFATVSEIDVPFEGVIK